MDFDKSSFRDPHGNIYVTDNTLFRVVYPTFAKEFDHLINSGLFDALKSNGLIVNHVDADPGLHGFDENCKVIKPELIQFISFPSEWCFSQLKDAALTTLHCQLIALNHGMILKDASAFNIQFSDGKPLLIDTLSFVFFKEGSPWLAYKQFCEHFLAPLVLVANTDHRLMRLYSTTGIPLDLVNKVLPLQAKLNLSVFLHISMHARVQRKYHTKKIKTENSSVFTLGYAKRLTENLIRSVERLSYKTKTTWGKYYETDVVEEYTRSKKEVIGKLLSSIKPSTLWDIGANNGEYSRIASREGIPTISMDADHTSIEENYDWVKEKKERNILPLLVNFTEPTPAVGWGNEERASLLGRGNPEAILMLAMIHHLVISDGIPMSKIADLLSKLCRTLILEFIPKTDPKVQILIQNREDIFQDFSQDQFERVFIKHFAIKGRYQLSGTSRAIYHFQVLKDR